jgi:hypothetical protein
MQDIKKYQITVNANTDTVPFTEGTDIFKISRNGIGMRIVNIGNTSFPGEDIGTYRYRAYNPGAVIPSGSSITLGASTSGLVNYTQNVLLGDDVIVGLTYTITIDGNIFTYTTVLGDDINDVGNNLTQQLNDAVLSFPITAVYLTLIDNVIIISTGGQRTYTVSLTGPNYWLSKSGLFWIKSGVTYIFNSSNGTETIPSLPAISGPYDFTTFTEAVGGLAFYLSDPVYSVIDTFEIEYFAGIATINNVPDSGSTSLGANDVVIDESGQVIKFGMNFIFGTPEKVSIIYK